MKKILQFLLIGIIIYFVSCSSFRPQPQTSISQENSIDGLSNLRQINDHPFYEYYYQGDYGFSDYIKTGEYQISQFIGNNYHSFACSCFSAFGDLEQPVLGRNFDWYDHPIMILFTSPSDGYRSISMVDIGYLEFDLETTPLDDPEGLRAAPYLPFDGMNEEGLAVGMMAVYHAEGGEDPEKITLDSLELIRLMLDYAATVDEAVELIQDFNVSFGEVPIHYIVADNEGNSAVIEYIDDKAIILRNEDNWQVATNFLLFEMQSLAAEPSCWRYNQLSSNLDEKEGIVDTQQAMEMLQGVSQPGNTATRWSVVYDLKNLTALVAINGDYKDLYEFTFNDQ